MKYLVIIAVALHFLTKFFWDYGVDYSYRDRFERGLRTESIKEIKSGWEGMQVEETRAYSRYSLGIAAVIFLWVIACQSKKRLSDKVIVVLEWWSFWVVSEVVKELANMFDVLTWLFNNPTEKYLSEYVIFFVSGGWVWWRLYRLKHSTKYLQK